VTAPAKTDIAAVVVLYEPGADVLDNIESYRSQVGHVIAVDNTVEPTDFIRVALAERSIEHLPLGENTGIAAALNTGCRRALELGYTWALTMDQDSTASPGMVPSLLGCAATDSERTGLVSPVHHQVGGEPRTVDAGCHEVLTAMTSGNLVNLAALGSVGWFMDDLFIDQVDNELCLRFWRAGLQVLECGDAHLAHRVGDLRKHRFPYPAYSSNHSAIRRYYITRNRLWVGRMYADDYPQFGRFERRQQIKDVVKIVLYEREKASKLAMVLRGWRDYRAGTLGAFKG
jgi:rhamnosyltransferase